MTFAETLTQDAAVDTLLEMLTYKRPHLSESEADWIARFIEPLQHHGNTTEYRVDGFGNIYLHVGHKPTRTLFTAHTDTVHRTAGGQAISYDAECELVFKPSGTEDTECLGADDGAGCAILCEMIRAGVPGWYAFFRGEERGGLGSTYLVKHDPKFLEQFDRAIAFDRKDNCSVISHQGWDRCASDTFAEELARQLNRCGEVDTYKPDDGGVFTDTANFTGIIPECTNVSVGYGSEHTAGEYLDVASWKVLRNAVLLIDWEALPTKRDPSVQDSMFDAGLYNYRYSWTNKPAFSSFPTTEEIMAMRYHELVSWVKRAAPEDVAEILCDLVDRLESAEDALHYDGQETPTEEEWN